MALHKSGAFLFGINACGRIWTSGTIRYAALAMQCHKPLGHASKSGWGRIWTCGVPDVTDLQSAALDQLGIPIHGVTEGSRTPVNRATICRTTVVLRPQQPPRESNPVSPPWEGGIFAIWPGGQMIPAGIEPSVSAVKVRCLCRLTKGPCCGRVIPAYF